MLLLADSSRAGSGPQLRALCERRIIGRKLDKPPTGLFFLGGTWPCILIAFGRPTDRRCSRFLTSLLDLGEHSFYVLAKWRLLSGHDHRACKELLARGR